MESIYLDNNATTPLLPAVWEAMRPFYFDFAGNPASSHHVGRKARQALHEARDQTAALLGAFADEILFTSGATEANNLAIFGLCDAPPGHLVISPIEHPCVTEPARHLAQSGFALDYLRVDADGRVIPDSLVGQLRSDTRLVALMLANHETGTIQPIEQLCALLPENIVFHCDAAAAAGKIPIDCHKLGVTTLTVSAHKFHGPKGVGALVLRRGTRLRPLLHGGHQQQGKRPGTEPVALAVGLATALHLAVTEMEVRWRTVQTLRHRFLDLLRAVAAPVVINGPEEAGVPHTLNVSFPGCAADLLLMNLDLAGVACSTGSACSSGSLLPSPVLQAMHVPDPVLRSALRFSFSPLLSEEAAIEAAHRTAAVVRRLRNAVPEE
jgi:cysteine desulfurase